MTPAAPFFLIASAVLLAGAAIAPVASPEPAPAPAPAPGEVELQAPAAQAEPDYTTRMSQPPLVGEYDPATAPPPYAAPPDEDGLRQCVGPDGVPIFTDRRCEDLGATPQQAPAVAGAHTVPGLVRVRTCARNQDDLLAGVRAALENHDANRLADYYHWTGMGTSEGYRLMERLTSFSARPVVDVQLVHSARPDADPYADPWFGAAPPPSPFEEVDPEVAQAGEAPAPPRRRPHALLLRVDQMRGETDAASTITYFRLLTNAGCWWMRF